MIPKPGANSTTRLFVGFALSIIQLVSFFPPGRSTFFPSLASNQCPCRWASSRSRLLLASCAIRVPFGVSVGSLYYPIMQIGWGWWGKDFVTIDVAYRVKWYGHYGYCGRSGSYGCFWFVGDFGLVNLARLRSMRCGSRAWWDWLRRDNPIVAILRKSPRMRHWPDSSTESPAAWGSAQFP